MQIVAKWQPICYQTFLNLLWDNNVGLLQWQYKNTYYDAIRMRQVCQLFRLLKVFLINFPDDLHWENCGSESTWDPLYELVIRFTNSSSISLRSSLSGGLTKQWIGTRNSPEIIINDVYIKPTKGIFCEEWKKLGKYICSNKVFDKSAQILDHGTLKHTYISQK